MSLDNGQGPPGMETPQGHDSPGDAPNSGPALTKTSTTPDLNGPAVSSQQVSWWDVHEYVAPMLTQIEAWPLLGSPEWCALDDDDPAKQAAIYDAAQHWALRLETCQEARCDASREISDAADWSAVAKETFVRNCFYAARPWLKRVVS